jgi:two-component system sensor histidine kinase KdpD
VDGSRNEKRWQDVRELLEEGINVISAVNIQHIESLNEEVKEITGVDVKERIPDSVLGLADEVVNIDLTSEELVARLKAGKIYQPEKVQLALTNFFTSEHILQLRELALKEVALRVSKKVENEFSADASHFHHEKFLACISANETTPRKIIRKTARLATHYNTDFIVLYVQTPQESADRIPLANQRHLSNHFKLATELGGEVIQMQSSEIIGSIISVCKERQITTVCMGQPALKMPQVLFAIRGFKKLIDYLAQASVDLIIVS